MKIIFMGTPDFAAVSLKALLDSGREVAAVVTNPDKPKGRGHKMMKPPVKELAEEAGIPVYQPTSLKGGELKGLLDEVQPDVICVVAYGRILPEYIISYPKYGCINVHGSLLPKYRGAAPIQWSVINGDEFAGVTTMLMDNGLDTGDMLLTEKVRIGESETSEELFDRLAPIGGELLCKTLNALETGDVTPVPQNDSESTYAPIIKKEMAEIIWSDSPCKICQLVRGMNSWPMAYTYYKGEPVKIISAVPGAEKTDKAPGTILGLIKKQGLSVSCGSGSIIIKEVQFPGSKRMNIEDYMRGHEINTGELFTSKITE